MKKFSFAAFLLPFALVSCSSTPVEEPFKFKVIANVEYYNSQYNHIKYDEEKDLYYAKINRNTAFYIHYRFKPVLYDKRDIAFGTSDESIVTLDKDFYGKFITVRKGKCNIWVEPIYHPEFKTTIEVEVI